MKKIQRKRQAGNMRGVEKTDNLWRGHKRSKLEIIDRATGKKIGNESYAIHPKNKKAIRVKAAIAAIPRNLDPAQKAKLVGKALKKIEQDGKFIKKITKSQTKNSYPLLQGGAIR